MSVESQRDDREAIYMEDSPLTPAEVARLRDNVNLYIEDEIESLEVGSINEMKESFKLFKTAIIDTRSQLQKFVSGEIDRE